MRTLAIQVISAVFASHAVASAPCERFLIAEEAQPYRLQVRAGTKGQVVNTLNLSLEQRPNGEWLAKATRNGESSPKDSLENLPYPPQFQVKAESAPHGVLFEPVAAQVKAPILHLHGSGGASKEIYYRQAYYLASQGHPVLLVNYFESLYGDGPANLKDIEIKNIETAALWLKNKYNKGFAVLGSSRGAELSLILGHLLAWSQSSAQPMAIIADRAAPFVIPAYFPAHNDPANWKEGKVYQEPVAANWIGTSPGPHMTLGVDAWLWGGQPLQTGAPLLVQEIPYRLMVIHGSQDEFWPMSFAVENQKKMPSARAFFHSEKQDPGNGDGHAQFHYFMGEKHTFQGWAQSRRLRMVLDFLNRP